MGKKFTILAIAFAIVAFTQPAYAQQAEKVYRIGYLQGSPNLGNRQVKAFRQGLRDLGYVEGKNITIRPQEGSWGMRSDKAHAGR